MLKKIQKKINASISLFYDSLNLYLFSLTGQNEKNPYLKPL